MCSAPSASATAQARSSIRLGFGRYTGEEELASACRRINEAAHAQSAASGMIKVRFLKADGTLDHEVEAPAGTNLLDLAQREGQPLEGACEGQMACSTCHVIVAKEDFGRLPPASEEEDDLLDLAWAGPADLAARLPDQPHRRSRHADRADAGRGL